MNVYILIFFIDIIVGSWERLDQALLTEVILMLVLITLNVQHTSLSTF